MSITYDPPTITASPTTASELLERHLIEIEKAITDFEAVANGIADMRAERERILAAMAALAGKPVNALKQRARRGKAEEIVAAIIADGRELNDKAVLEIAREQPDAPSDSALRRALRAVRDSQLVKA